jgi:putative membrane protein
MHARNLTRLVIGGLALCLGCAAAAQSVSGTPSTASKGDVTFMTHATAEGTAQIKLGQLATERSSNDDVTMLAQRMVTDHTRANGKLLTLAHGKKVAPPPAPAEPDSALTTLKGLSGMKFNQAWADAVVKNQQRAVALFASESRQAQDPDVKNFADSMLPTLHKHLDMARKLQKQLSFADTRDSAIDSHPAMSDSTFDQVAHPASSATATMPMAPESAASKGGVP